jgi:ribosomal protein L7Ae-like RNA K-turn-binding protein
MVSLIIIVFCLGVLKGVAEVVKALERQEVKIVFMAEDCDNDQYKELVNALARQYQVPVVEVPTWIELKDLCKLGYPSETIIKMAEDKKKEPKIKPRCSVAAIVVSYFF